MTDELLVDRRGPVTRLTLNRPAKLNALNTALADQLLAAISVATGEGTRLLVVEGPGGGLSDGFDFGGLDQESDGDLALRFVRLELLLLVVPARAGRARSQGAHRRLSRQPRQGDVMSKDAHMPVRDITSSPPRCGRYGSSPDKRSIPARICPSLSPAYPNSRPARCGGLI